MTEPLEHRHALITVRPHGPGMLGPYRVEGDWILVDLEGNPVPLSPTRKDLKRISLCGCGQSKTWPVCDGTHKELGVRQEPGGGNDERPAP